MKNANEIKSEAKEQIIKLLNMCGCYAYEEQYIDRWLDEWEKACSPQIEAIAEKSPYYDGKCKIVFPSEYPREFNVNGIKNFVRWLTHYINRAVKRLEPLRFDGFTYREIMDLDTIYSYLDTITSINDCSEALTGEFKEIYSRLLKIYNTEEVMKQRQRRNDAYRKYRYSGNFDIINNNAYSRTDLEKIGVYKASELANILSSKNARTQFLDDDLADWLNNSFPECKFAKGQKLSRAVNSIASKYRINEDPDWNKEFAKYADSINPLNVTKWTVISWHPMDYLTFCFGNSWSTCSNIDKHNVRGIKIGDSRSSITSYVNEDYVFRGEHSAAALSYMFDKTSFIYYTVNHKYDGTHYEEQDKESRIVFSLSEDNTTLLQSRLYPQCNDDNSDDSAYRIPREIVQKVIADALGKPNLWKMKKGYEFCREYAKSTGVHYADYTDDRNKECNISWMGDEPHVIHLGHNAICPKCGCIHDYTGSLNCSECDPEYRD